MFRFLGFNHVTDLFNEIESAWRGVGILSKIRVLSMRLFDAALLVLVCLGPISSVRVVSADGSIGESTGIIFGVKVLRVSWFLLHHDTTCRFVCDVAYEEKKTTPSDHRQRETEDGGQVKVLVFRPNRWKDNKTDADANEFYVELCTWRIFMYVNFPEDGEKGITTLTYCAPSFRIVTRIM